MPAPDLIPLIIVNEVERHEAYTQNGDNNHYEQIILPALRAAPACPSGMDVIWQRD